MSYTCLMNYECIIGCPNKKECARRKEEKSCFPPKHERQTMARIEKHQTIYVRSMGKALRVTAMFTNDAEANSYMEKNPDEGVIAEIQGVIFLANAHDYGAKITD